MAKRYDEQVLAYLLDHYENSTLYDGKNKNHVSIAFPVTKKTLPEYFDLGSMKYDEIHEQLLELEHRGYVRLVWKGGRQGHILLKCVLCEEHTDDIYGLLHRVPRRTREAELHRICADYKGKHAVLDAFLAWIEERLEEGGSIKQYADLEDPAGFERICRLTAAILKNREECFLRPFSIRVFRDSKTAEQEIGLSASIIRRFSANPALTDLTSEEILQEYHIFKNPSWIMMKGQGAFQIGGRITSLEAFAGGIGIPGPSVSSMRWEQDSGVEAVLTIENLTSFHQWKKCALDGKRLLCIYLGGYANPEKRELLKAVYSAFPRAEYLHFGDMDCGGFRIWKALCGGTGIPFRPFRMDEAAYMEYLAYGKELTQTDRKTLTQMMEDAFYDGQRKLFVLMLEKGIKIEQECITAE